MFYSKSTGGFYDHNIHGDNIPFDVVEITTEAHMALLNGQSQGKKIVANDLGYPVLVDPPAPTETEIQQQKNVEARAYLASTDWYIIRLQETGIPVPTNILAARQAARDSIIQ